MALYLWSIQCHSFRCSFSISAFRLGALLCRRWACADGIPRWPIDGNEDYLDIIFIDKRGIVLYKSGAKWWQPAKNYDRRLKLSYMYISCRRRYGQNKIKLTDIQLFSSYDCFVWWHLGIPISVILSKGSKMNTHVRILQFLLGQQKKQKQIYTI